MIQALKTRFNIWRALREARIHPDNHYLNARMLYEALKKSAENASYHEDTILPLLRNQEAPLVTHVTILNQMKTLARGCALDVWVENDIYQEEFWEETLTEELRAQIEVLRFRGGTFTSVIECLKRGPFPSLKLLHLDRLKKPSPEEGDLFSDLFQAMPACLKTEGIPPGRWMHLLLEYSLRGRG